MSRGIIKKETVLSVTTPADIFSYYAKTSNFRKNVPAPYRKDEKPSVSINPEKGDFGVFNDHGSEAKGDCFDFASACTKIPTKRFGDLLWRISDDMGLNVQPEKPIKKPKAIDFTNDALGFWEEYNVKKNHLIELGVNQYRLKDGRFGFIFNSNEGLYKQYVPAQNGKAKQFPFNSINRNVIVGIEYVQNASDVVITAGEKDRIVLYANTGICGVNFQSETTEINQDQFNVINQRSKRLFICYDNDDTGSKSAEKICSEYPDIIDVKLPSNVNDIADYFKNGHSKYDFEKLLDEAYMRKDFKVYVSNNEYQDKNKKRLSNFILECRYMVGGNTDYAYRIARIISNNGSTDYMEVETDRLSSLSAFTRWVESKGNYNFFGKQSDLDNIKEREFNKSSLVDRSEYYGYNPDFDLYLFTNGVLTPDGRIITPNEFNVVELQSRKDVYVENNSNAQDLLEYIPGNNISFNDWTQLLIDVYGAEKAIFGALHVALALFYDILMSRLMYFPLLFGYGAPGSGKTSFARSLRKVFMPRKTSVPTLGNTTAIAMGGLVSQYSCALVHFDEYKNDTRTANQREHAKIIERLKGFYDGSGRTKSTKENNNKTYSDEVRSAVVVTGEHMPTDQAVMQRSIFLQFDHNNHSSESFLKLQDQQDKGLSSLIVELFKLRSIIKEDFDNVYAKSKSELRKLLSDNNILEDERTIKHYAMYYTMHNMLLDNLLIKKDLGIKDVIIKSVREHKERLISQNPISVFWEIIDERVYDGQNHSHPLEKALIYGEHITIVKNDLVAIAKKGLQIISKIMYEDYNQNIPTSQIERDLTAINGYHHRDRSNNKALFPKSNRLLRSIWFHKPTIEKNYNVEIKYFNG